MSDRLLHTRIFQKCLEVFLTYARLESLLPMVLSRHLITQREYERISRTLARQGPMAATEELFTGSLMRNPDPQCYYKVAHAFEELDRPELVRLMREECFKLKGRYYEEICPEEKEPGISVQAEYDHPWQNTPPTQQAPVQQGQGNTGFPQQESGYHTVQSQALPRQEVGEVRQGVTMTTAPNHVIQTPQREDVSTKRQAFARSVSVPSRNVDTSRQPLFRRVESMDYEGDVNGIVQLHKQDHIAPTDPTTFVVPQINPKELNLDRNQRIGCGTFGIVFKCNWKGLEVAVKEMNIPLRRRNVSREVDIAVRHPNIVHLMAFGLDHSAVLLVYEFLPGYSLERILFDEEVTEKYHLSQRDKYAIGRQITQAVAYLQDTLQPPMCHGDIKPANLIVAESSLRTKLCDLGVSKIKNKYAHTVSGGVRGAGTPVYMAPEQLVGEQSISVRTDLYNTGATLFELFAGVAYWDFGDVSDGKMIREIQGFMQRKEGSPQLRYLAAGDVKTVVLNCVAYDENLRPSASQLDGWMGQLCEDGRVHNWRG